MRTQYVAKIRLLSMETELRNRPIPLRTSNSLRPKKWFNIMLLLDQVSRVVEEKPQAFITGDKELVDAALLATKYLFDLSLQQESPARSFVANLIRAYEPSTKPVTRSQARAAATEQRSPTPPQKTDNDIWKPTPIDSLLLDGMDDDQIWAQLELRTANLCETLENILEKGPIADEDELGEDVDLDAEGDDEEDEEEFDFDGFEDGDIEFGDEEDEDEDEDEDGDEDGDGDENEDENGLHEEITSLHDPSDEETADEEMGEEDDEDSMDLDKHPTSKLKLSSTTISPQRLKRKGGHPILDDDFFSLTEFKAEIEKAEAKYVSRGHLNDQDDDEDEDIESDIDLFTPVDNTDFDEEDLDAGEPYYNDFFAPPKGLKPDPKRKLIKKKVSISKPKKGLVRFNDEVKVRKIKRTGKGMSVKALNEFYEDEDEDEDEDAEEELEEYLEDDDDGSDDEEEEDEEGSENEDGGRDAIERFKDDLFADDDEDMQSRNVSSHEARQAEIAAQIKELEAENVAPKPWALMGEATTRSRPVDSLLEEDLDFDRVMKAVPVITEESVSSLEDMIKRRILENKFDDVVRKRAVEDKPFLPSRLFELDDKKSSKGLAEIYEDEYTAAASGTSTDVRDKKLQEQHAEITEMWEKICYKLDALSNAHFTPKPPKATITTISNVATATLESALPTTVASTTMLAPEEIYAPGTSALRSKEEMTPLEKKSLRNQQRKARKKAQDLIKLATDKVARTQGEGGSGKKPFGMSIKKEKEKALKSIVKVGKGVSVIGKQNKQKQKENQGSKALKL